MASLKQKVDQCLVQLGCEKAPTMPEQVKEIATQLGVLNELNGKTLVQQVDYVHEVMFGANPNTAAAPVVIAVVVGEGQNPIMVEACDVPVVTGATRAPVQETMGGSIFDRSRHPNGGPRHDQSVICVTGGFLLPFIICPTHCLSTWGCADVVDGCTSTPGFKHIPCSPCDPNSKNPLWCCAEPLGWAASFGQLHTVMVLVKNGAIPDTKNAAGQNAWSDARRERHQHVVEWLNKWKSAGRPTA